MSDLSIKIHLKQNFSITDLFFKILMNEFLIFVHYYFTNFCYLNNLSKMHVFYNNPELIFIIEFKLFIPR